MEICGFVGGNMAKFWDGGKEIRLALEGLEFEGIDVILENTKFRIVWKWWSYLLGVLYDNLDELVIFNLVTEK